MTWQCRGGHASTEDDYCSVCGAAMPKGQGANAATAARGIADPLAVAAKDCPSCGEPRADRDARFCEVCRYDFVERKGGPPPAVATNGPSPTAANAASPATASVALKTAPAALASTVSAWELSVAVDATLDTEPDPKTPCPIDEPEHVFGFDVAEMLVGRRDDRRDIRPEIPLSDPGTSRRHAKFLKNVDGSISIQDLASMNGTKLNGTDMVAGSRQVLKDGDLVTLGRWTSIRIRKKS